MWKVNRWEKRKAATLLGFRFLSARIIWSGRIKETLNLSSRVRNCCLLISFHFLSMWVLWQQRPGGEPASPHSVLWSMLDLNLPPSGSQTKSLLDRAPVAPHGYNNKLVVMVKTQHSLSVGNTFCCPIDPQRPPPLVDLNVPKQPPYQITTTSNTVTTRVSMAP